MRNSLALCIVALLLGACASYTYENTHVPVQPRVFLIDSYPSTHWDHYVRSGGAFASRND